VSPSIWLENRINYSAGLSAGKGEDSVRWRTVFRLAVSSRSAGA